MPIGYSEFSPPTPTVALEPATVAPAEDAAAVTAEATANSTPTSPTKVVEQLPTLDQELTNVMAGLGSFWGKVKKSSVSAYQTSTKQIDQLATTARTDLTPLLLKTKQNLDHFGETAKAELNRLSEASKLDVNSGTGGDVGEGEMFVGADGNVVFISTVGSGKKDLKGKGVDRSEHSGETVEGTGSEAASTTSTEPTPAAQATAFFSKLGTQLSSNPNFTTLSKNLSNIQSQVSTNLATLPNSLTSNLNHLSNQLNSIDLHDSTKKAEEYLAKGEGWISELGNEVGRLAKEAVTVLPPTSTGTMSKDKEREERIKAAEQVAVGRKETLLLRLRSEAAIILVVDPSQPSGSATDTSESYAKFLKTIQVGSDEFKTKIENELALTVNHAGEQLKEALAELVPSSMTSEVFWERYFFRVSQIEEDEIRRKRVLSVAAEETEDFSWDADEEEEDSAPPSAPSPLSPLSPLAATSQLSPAPATPTPLTHKSLHLDEASTASTVAGEEGLGEGGERRESSEATTESYDLVGIKSGEGSENDVASVPTMSATTSGSGKKEEVEKKDDSGEDSDWE